MREIHSQTDTTSTITIALMQKERTFFKPECSTLIKEVACNYVKPTHNAVLLNGMQPDGTEVHATISILVSIRIEQSEDPQEFSGEMPSA